MTISTTSQLTLACLLGLTCSACVTGPEAPAVPPEMHGPGADPRVLLEELALQSVVSDGHRELEPLTGDWNVVLFAANTGEPLARGTARLEWKLDGKVLQWETELYIGDRRAPSLALFGYDPRSNLYQLAWSSGLTSTTSLAYGRGELDSFGLRMVTEVRDPDTGHTLRARTVIRKVDDKTFELVQETEERPTVWVPITRTVYTRPFDPTADDSEFF